MDKPYELPQSRLLPTLVIFVFICGFLYGLFLLFQYWRIQSNLSGLEDRTVELQTEMDALREQQIEELYLAQELKNKVEESAVFWSKVIRSFQDYIPVTVFLTSYSAGEDGGLQVTGVGDSYGAVADLLTALEKANQFVQVFVPSVTLGTTTDGQSVASFSLKLHYTNP